MVCPSSDDILVEKIDVMLALAFETARFFLYNLIAALASQILNRAFESNQSADC